MLRVYIELEISLSETQLAHIVDNTFLDADLDHNGVIDLNEYQVRRALFARDGLGILTDEMWH